MLGELDIGASLFDEEGAALVNSVMAKAKQRKVKVLFPTDHIVSESFKSDAKVMPYIEQTPVFWFRNKLSTLIISIFFFFFFKVSR